MSIDNIKGHLKLIYPYLKSLASSRRITMDLINRDIQSQYLGSYLGINCIADSAHFVTKVVIRVSLLPLIRRGSAFFAHLRRTV